MCFSVINYLNEVSSSISQFILDDNQNNLQVLVDEIYKQKISGSMKANILRLFHLWNLVKEKNTGIIQAGISVKFQSYIHSVPLAYFYDVPVSIKDSDALDEYKQRHEFILSKQFFEAGFDEPMEQCFYSKEKKKRIACIMLTNDKLPDCPTIASKNVFDDDEINEIKLTVKKIIEDNKKKEQSERYTKYAEELAKLSRKFLTAEKVKKGKKEILEFVQQISRLSLDDKILNHLVITIMQSMLWNWINGEQCKYIYYIVDCVSDSSFASGFCLVSSRILDQSLLECLGLLVDRFFGSVYFLLATKIALNAHSKSAIGSIMSRNGSHNIGSHVLSSLTHNIGTMPDDRILYQYIQQRMDFIATVTTDFPPWGISTKFVGDIMKNFFMQRHLLENIARSEGLTAFQFQNPQMQGSRLKRQKSTIRLFIRNRLDAGNSHEDGYIDYHADMDKPIDLKNDVELSIPGGVVGEHAFYTIIENIVRNAAKHDWSSRTTNRRNLDIYIDFKPVDDYENIEFTIWSSLSDVWNGINENEFKKSITDVRTAINNEPSKNKKRKEIPPDNKLPHKNPDKKEYDQTDLLPLKRNYAKTLFEYERNPHNSKIVLPLHWRLQMLLEQPFISDEGSLRRENWGMAEMKISAGYLQGRSISEIGGLEDVKNNESIIQAIRVKDEKENVYHLGYRFNVPCPKEILIVIPESDEDIHEPKQKEGAGTVAKQLVEKSRDKGVLQECRKQGVYFASISKFEDNDHICRMITADDSGKEFEHFDYHYIIFPWGYYNTSPKKIQNKYEDKISKILKSHNFKHLIEFEESSGIFVPWHAPFPNRLLLDGYPEDEDEENKVDCDLVRKNLEELFRDENSKNIETYVKNLKDSVYLTWLKQIKKSAIKRKELVDNGMNFTLQLQTESSGSGGKSLVSNRDLLEVVFRECYHSTIGSLLNRIDSDKTEIRMILRLLQVYPKPQERLPQTSDCDDIKAVILMLVKMLCDDLKTIYGYIHEQNDMLWALKQEMLQKNQRLENLGEKTKEQQVTNEEVKLSEEGQRILSLAEQYHERLENTDNSDVNTFVKETSPKEFQNLLDDFLEANDVVGDRILKSLFGDDDDENDSILDPLIEAQKSGLNDMVDALYAAYETSDIFLRKYEERIPTLPVGYSKLTDDMQEISLATINQYFDKNNVDIKLVTSDAMIKYCRHDKELSNNGFYAEALSGSQTYLNQLHQLLHSTPDGNLGQFVQLVENGLIRVLVMDERVSNFLKPRPEMIKTFSAMRIWAIDPEMTELTENDITVRTDKLLVFSPQKEKKDFDIEIPDKTFDILIIHQGIIDKWWEGGKHDRSNVARLLLNHQRHVPYVVVTTGRGRPDNIPNFAKVLPFSTVESCLFRSNPEKLTLVNTVMNILPNDKED